LDKFNPHPHNKSAFHP